MTIERGIARKLLGLAGTGESDEALRIAKHSFRRGMLSSEVVALIGEHVAAEFIPPMVKALPWLAAETFDGSSPDGVSDEVRDRILRMVSDAADEGAKLSAMRIRFNNREAFDSAVAMMVDEGLIAAADIRGRAGPPARYYFLPQFAPSIDAPVASGNDDESVVLAALVKARFVGADRPALAKACRSVKDMQATLDALVAKRWAVSEVLATHFTGDRPRYWVTPGSPLLRTDSGEIIVDGGLMQDDESWVMRSRMGLTERPDPIDPDPAKWTCLG